MVYGTLLRSTLMARLPPLVVAALFVLSIHVCTSEDTSAPAAAEIAPPPLPHRAHWMYAPSAPSLYRAYDTTPRLHFAVMCLPLWGHFKAVHAVAEELAFRGHHVTYFVENPAWCDVVQVDSKTRSTTAPWDVDCVVVTPSENATSQRPLFSSAFFSKISRYSSTLRSVGDLSQELLAHHAQMLPAYLETVATTHRAESFTTFLCDLTTFACGSVARSLDVSAVHVFPFTLQLSLGFHSELPAMGTALPRHMTLWQRTGNFFVKLIVYTYSGFAVAQLNRVRDKLGIPPYKNVFDVVGLYDTILAPGLWGLDIPQPLCANIHPVGALLTRSNLAATPHRLTDKELVPFLDRCKQGVIYVNFGTRARLSAAMVGKLTAAFRNLPFCVVWKLPKSSPSIPPTQNDEDDSSLFFVRTWFSAPIAIMRHPNVLVFVSHCGVASVMESITAGLPVLGLPIFGHQGDVCQRIAETGIGICLPGKYSFTARDVEQAVWSIVRRSSDVTANLRQLQMVSAALGGPARAADIIETRQYNLLLRPEASMERCAALGDDAWAAAGVAKHWFVLLMFAVLWWLLLERLRRGLYLMRLLRPLWTRCLRVRWESRSGDKPAATSQLRFVPRRYRHDSSKVD